MGGEPLFLPLSTAPFFHLRPRSPSGSLLSHRLSHSSCRSSRRHPQTHTFSYPYPTVLSSHASRSPPPPSLSFLLNLISDHVFPFHPAFYTPSVAHGPGDLQHGHHTTPTIPHLPSSLNSRDKDHLACPLRPSEAGSTLSTLFLFFFCLFLFSSASFQVLPSPCTSKINTYARTPLPCPWTTIGTWPPKRLATRHI